MKFHNGQVYDTPIGKAVIVFLGHNQGKVIWGVLYLDPNIIPGLTAPLFFQKKKEGKFGFTKSQLFKRLKAHQWKLLDERVDFIPIEPYNLERRKNQIV
ncbi:MAG: hypothetical protein ACP5N7_02495 [Candidatus Pacearchaeota archaeon]